ncbi:MAG: ATP-binding protein [Lachnospiraceae bacterium]|nr:ATP-binding protein [Lachnospiraceae bacterium]MBR5765557.1 ATP-binding protein [Lachnospiraceae bacterium]MBR6485447.1 ATP-binding protein [Lachnospiraceae bacterium]
MSISNAQYDEIMRAFENNRNNNRHLLMQRRDEVYDKIPEYKALDSKVADISLKLGMELIDGDASALASLRDEIKGITEKKKELLRAGGFLEDYLEPIYTCNECKDTGYVEGVKCRCLKQAIIRHLYKQSNIENILKKENFDTLTYDLYDDTEIPVMEGIIKSCKDYVRDFNDEYANLLFYGGVGVGKTFLTNCIAKELLEQGHSVLYFTAFQLFDTLAKYAFRSGEVSESIDRVHEDIFDCDLLIIDDLGTELTNAFVLTQLFLIINERDLRNRSTIISTNLSIEELSERYSERVFSRIYGKYRMIKPDIKDLRIKIKRSLHRK